MNRYAVLENLIVGRNPSCAYSVWDRHREQWVEHFIRRQPARELTLKLNEEEASRVPLRERRR